MLQIKQDHIPFATVLDSSASVSFLGKDAVKFFEQKKMALVNLSLKIKTADANNQHIKGNVTIAISRNKITDNMDFYVVASLQQRLYLRFHFWKKFHVAPNIISA